jgi:hypothetical protein
LYYERLDTKQIRRSWFTQTVIHLADNWIYSTMDFLSCFSEMREKLNKILKSSSFFLLGVILIIIGITLKVLFISMRQGVSF